MLNFRNTNIFFSALLVLAICAEFFLSVPIFIFVLIVLAYLAMLFYGSYDVASNFYAEVICSGQTKEKEIAISFDDGPVKEFTPLILDILEESDVKAAFFCIGRNIEGNKELLKRMHGNGHLIGNHSFSHHRFFDFFSSAKMLADMQAMDSLAEKIIGIRPKLFRPPYGVTNPNLHRAIVNGHFTAIGWSIRSFDTMIRNEKKLLKRVSTKLKPGDIILFHDTGKATLAILPAFIRTVRNQGFRITRLDKMLKLNPYD